MSVFIIDFEVPSANAFSMSGNNANYWRFRFTFLLLFIFILGFLKQSNLEKN